MTWKCPECGSYNHDDDMAKCGCGYDDSKTTSGMPLLKKNENGRMSASFYYNVTTLMLSIAASLFTLCMMVKAGQPGRLDPLTLIGWIAAFVGFGTWAISPYVMIVKKSQVFNITVKQAAVFLIATIFIASLGCYVIFDTFFIHPDAQGGLVFLSLPGIQWIGVIITLLLSQGKWAKNR